MGRRVFRRGCLPVYLFIFPELLLHLCQQCRFCDQITDCTSQDFRPIDHTGMGLSALSRIYICLAGFKVPGGRTVYPAETQPVPAELCGYGISFNYQSYICHFQYEKPISYFETGYSDLYIPIYAAVRKDSFMPTYTHDMIRLLTEAFQAG